MDATAAPVELPEGRLAIAREYLIQAREGLDAIAARVAKTEDERDKLRRDVAQLERERERFLLLIYGAPPCAVPDCQHAGLEIIWAVWPHEGPLCQLHHGLWTSSPAFREFIALMVLNQPRRQRTARALQLFWGWVVARLDAAPSLSALSEVVHG